MLQIKDFAVENMTKGCVTDEVHPKFTFALEGDAKDANIKQACISVGSWHTNDVDQRATRYDGEKLSPFSDYNAFLSLVLDNGEKAESTVSFSTGRMDTPWQGKWISDASYSFTEKKVSPVPMTFRKKLELDRQVKKAVLYSTALGIYELEIDGKKVGDRYFAPGFTSYSSYLQYQTYDVTEMIKNGSTIMAHVAGGWAVGSFVFTRVNRQAGDRQALLAELHITYEDGTKEVIGTDESWQVTEEGPFRMADLYDGETYDATVDMSRITWRYATPETLRISPQIVAESGAPVKAHEVFEPVSAKKVNDEIIYDFGQNFAGVVRITVNAKKGQKIEVRHAEIINPDGSLCLTFLRSAKATATYIAVDGEQTYMPTMTYMGFRYISVSGIDESDIVRIEGVAMYSDLTATGSFSCSNELINKLQENIRWGAKSNLFDIPTDCPQRDERMGWTGDINVFAPTACYNFDMSRFLKKWLRDMRSEQLPSGGIPNTIPLNGYGFPATMPKMAVDWWDDACVCVPWAEYQARGDISVLKDNYPMMKKYIKACLFWAGLFSFGKKKYIWDTPSVLHFGDWVAPDVPKMSQWQARAKWTATASLANTSHVTGLVASELGLEDEASYYEDISTKVKDAYVSVFTDGQGKLLGEQFQTGYVLPIYLNMFDEKTQKKAAANLAELVKKNDYRIGTGFPGTPYILFALAQNSQEDVAFKMLENTDCPSWLYEVKAGATTIWERWDGLDENGQCPISDDGTDMMISYNHYASGAVGDFLYKEVAGIRPTSPGYETFSIAPRPGGSITSAKGTVETPYGSIVSDWKLEDGKMTIDFTVPIGTRCELVLPGREPESFGSGNYRVTG